MPLFGVGWFSYVDLARFSVQVPTNGSAISVVDLIGACADAAAASRAVIATRGETDLRKDERIAPPSCRLPTQLYTGAWDAASLAVAFSRWQSASTRAIGSSW